MGKNFATLQNKFNQLTETRTRALDRKFDKIESIIDSTELLTQEEQPMLVDSN